MLGNSRHLWLWDYEAAACELTAAGFRNVRRAQLGIRRSLVSRKSKTKDVGPDASAWNAYDNKFSNCNPALNPPYHGANLVAASMWPQGVSGELASAVRWEMRYKTTRQVSPSPLGGNRRSGRVEAQRDYLLGLICRSFYLIRRTPDLTLLEIQERLIHNCGERFSISVLWRVFDAMASRLKRMARSVCKRVYRDRRLISLLVL